MTAVWQLVPGDQVEDRRGGPPPTFVQRAQHPLWPGLQLVIWRMPDGSWSHDALDGRQEVGQAVPATEAERTQRLREALLGDVLAVAAKGATGASETQAAPVAEPECICHDRSMTNCAHAERGEVRSARFCPDLAKTPPSLCTRKPPPCPRCSRAPVQQSDRANPQRPRGTVAWWEHELAWHDYHRRWPGQSAERIAERGGFGWDELVDQLGHEPTTWQPLVKGPRR